MQRVVIGLDIRPSGSVSMGREFHRTQSSGPRFTFSWTVVILSAPQLSPTSVAAC